MENKKSTLQQLIQNEVIPLLEVKTTDRLWHIPLLTSLCSVIPLLTGLFLHRLSYGIVASMAGFIILYLPSSGIQQRLITLLVCSFGFMFSLAVGLCFSFNIYASVIAFSILTFIVHFAIKYYALKPPGNFFFIMIASIASCIPFEPSGILIRVGLMGLGTMLACVLAMAYSLMMIKKYPPQEEPIITPNVYLISIEALITALFLGGALLTAHLLKLENPYWVPVSCLAVMQGLNFRHVWQRSIHRITGTFIGLGLTYLLLKLQLIPLTLCVSVFVLQFIVEMLIVRHYGLAVIFMTPLTIFLAEANKAMHANPDLLVTARFQDIVLGSVIGAIGGWVLYHEQLRTNAEKVLREW